MKTRPLTAKTLPLTPPPQSASPRRPGRAWWLLALLTLGCWPAAGQWSQVANTGPSARWYSSMAEAPALAQTILFGGSPNTALLGDTWNWNGSAWQQLTPAGASPGARYTHGLAYLANSTNHQVVLFGGIGAGSQTLGDTWLWNGTGWRQVTGSGPPTRFVVRMASDLGRGRVVLFGGFTGSTYRGDTWEWDGTSWTQRVVTGPSARGGHAMAYDAARGRVVLFGGETAPGVYSGQTWEWDGTSWLLASTNGPSPRREHAMSYRGGRVVLNGGVNMADVVLGDTWEWDGTTWTPTVSGCPSPRLAHTMTTESATDTALLFGGRDVVSYGDTWRYAGGLFITQPASLTVVEGQPASFLVQVKSSAGSIVTYQWQRDCGAGFAPIGGATNSTYTIPTTAASDACRYRCFVSVGGCTAVSLAARLNVLSSDSPPIITQQPQSVTATPGQPVMFSVTAVGGQPLSYQWSLNGTALPGATVTELDLGPAEPSDAGTYTVEVSNPYGFVTSVPATLTFNAVAPSNQWNVWVADAGALAVVQSEVGALGGTVAEASLYFLRVSFSSTEAAFQQIAGLPGVIRAEAEPLAVVFNYNSRTSINTLKVQAAPYGAGVPGLTGLGVVGGVWDGGTFGLTHPDWLPRLTVMENCVANFGNDTHAAHVIGTMAGNGIWFNNSLAGMAPRATIKDWSFNNCGGPFSAPSVPTEQLNARNLGLSSWPAPRVDYTQNSWGYMPANCSFFGAYMGYCADFDKLVRQEALPIFFAAGNAQQQAIGMGCSGAPFTSGLAPGTAKNVVTVGALDLTDTVAIFSSFGPTLDGRLKPDVMALGDPVYSTTDPGWQGIGYFSLSGTSMATPAVSGTAALLIEQFRNLTLPDPSPALLKAIFCNTATDLGNAGPDFKYGYGKVNAEKAVDTIVSGQFHDEVINTAGVGGITTGGVWTNRISVTQGCALRVTLAWSDLEYQGTSWSAPTLINDLDLELVDPSSGIHLPLTLTPGTPNALAIPAVNRRDNVEQVVIPSALGGTWTLVVKGFNVPAGPQEFAVAWCVVCPPPCQPQPINGLWNTGFDTNGVPLATGAVDPHYNLIAAPGGFTDARHNYFGSPWLPDGPGSFWLQPGPAGYAPNGIYIYELTFDLGNCDPNTASITGRWAADDWAELRINNVTVPGVNAAYGFSLWSPLSITSGFTPGVNTIQFVVHNLGGHPTGLRVELGGTVCCNPCVTPPTNMVAWWPLDEPTGSPVVNETVASMNGTVVPGPLGSPFAPMAIPGKVAGAMYAIHPSGYAQVPPLPPLDLALADFTIDAWIYPVQCSTNALYPIVDKLDPGNPFDGYALYITGGQLTLSLGDPNVGGQVFTAPQPLNYNSWNFIGVIVDYANSTVTFYVNGIAQPAFGPPPLPAGPTPNSPLWIGGSRLYNATTLHCEIGIDELEFFNRALSTNDLTPIFRADSAGKCKTHCQGGFQCAPDKTVKCDAQWSFDPPTSTIPGCQLQPISVSTVTNFLAPCGVQYVRTWTFVDCCGLVATCTQSVTSVDTTPPVVHCPTNKTVECGSQWSFDVPTALDDCCGTNVTISLLTTFTNQPLPLPCVQYIRRGWLITDCCQNSIVCSQTVTVTDTTPPVINCASNKTVQCGSQWTFDPPSALDACCGTNVTITVLNTSTNGTGPCQQTITRTWAALDCCHNPATCSQTVTVVDSTPPVFATICVTNVLTVGTATDNFVGPEPASPSPGLMARMAAAGLPLKGFDDCTVNRGVAHTFLMPPGCIITSARLTVRLKPCGSLCDNDALGLSFTDATGTLLPGSWGRYLGAGNPSAGLFPGNWCTNTTGATLVLDLAALPLAPSGTVDLLPNLNANGFLDFTLQDDSAVDFLSLEIVACCCAPDKTVACGSQWSFDPPTAVDACCGTNVTVNVISTVTNLLAPCTLQITRTWEARDCCGSKAICSQTVTVIDNTPPVINCAALQALPITVTNACDGVIPDFCLPQYYSDLCCGISNCVQTPPAGTVVGPGTHAVTLTVTDFAGNVAICTLTFTVNGPSQTGVWNTGGVGPLAANFTVISAPAPIITPTPAVVTTTPGAWLPNSTQSRWVSYTGNSSSAPPGVYVYRLSFVVPCTNGASITGRFLSDDTARIYLNNSATPAYSASFGTWTPVNLTGPFVPGLNTLDVYVTNAIIWTGIRTELTNNFNCCCPNAVVLVCSSNKVVQCGTQWSFDPPMVGNTNCGGWTTPPPIILSTITNVTGNCSQTVTRTWRATDCCGNAGTCSQTVTVVDTTPPVITCALPVQVECGTPWSFSPPTAFDACCGTNVTITAVSTVTNGQCPTFITRTWEARDCCGNKAVCSQLIRVEDTTPPVITWCPPSFSVPAGQPWSFNTPQATDTCCGPTIVTLATTTNVSNCLITYTRYWRARDCCGNYSTICSQSVTTSSGSVPPNDQCVAAIPLTLNAAYLCGNNICATPTPAAILSQVPCGWSANSPDVWYTVTPVCSGLLTVDTCQPCPGRPVFDTVLSAYTGNCGGPLVQVPATWPQTSCNDDACGLQSRITFPVIAGQTYRIRVAGFNNAVGWFAIRATMTVTPPSNDLCVNAIPVTVGNPAACGTTLCGATPTPVGTLVPAPCGGSLNSADVWYRFTPTCSGPVTMTTCFTCPPFGTFDTVLSVYTGNCGGPLNQVAGGCNDDAPAGPCVGTLQSYVQFNATAGVTYYIRVAGFVGQTGDFRLNINQTVLPPANDLCANATPIGAGTYAWNNCGANTDGPATGTCVPQRDVWFRYLAPCNGAVQVTTCGSPIDTVLAVYSGNCLTPVLVGCNDNATSGPCNASPQSFVTFNAVAGQSYLIRVGGAGAATGAGVLNVTGPVPAPGTCGSSPFTTCRLYRIIGNGNGTPWAWSLSSPCCANLQNLNVPGVVGPSWVVAQQFANSINAVCPGTASTFTIFGNTYLMVCLRCGPNAAVNLAVGPAGTPPQNLCLVTGAWLPTFGPCSFNPDIVEEPLSGQDANGNGTDDYLDILSGTSQDRNGNGIPDEAEDCFAPELLAKPESVLAEPGVDAVLTVEISGTAPFRYQWLRDGTPVTDGPNVSGSTSNVLSITPVTREDLGAYSVIVSNRCGALTTAPVEVVAPTLTLPVIYDASLVDGWFRFYVDTKIGFDYVIEYKDDLGATGAWQPLTTVPGIGAPQLIYDSEPPADHRFYRVMQRPAGTP